MKRAYTNGILLDGTEQMEPVRGKVLLTENDKITAIAKEIALILLILHISFNLSYFL